MVPENRRQINELITVAAGLQELLENHGWQFCFIGGVAVQAWSEPRYTKDEPEIVTRLESLRAKYSDG